MILAFFPNNYLKKSSNPETCNISFSILKLFSCVFLAKPYESKSIVKSAKLALSIENISTIIYFFLFQS